MQLMGFAQEKGTKIYLHTTSLILNLISSLVDVLVDTELPCHLDQERGTNLLFKLLLPFLDDYLYEEQAYVNKACEEGIENWVSYKYAWQLYFLFLFF